MEQITFTAPSTGTTHTIALAAFEVVDGLYNAFAAMDLDADPRAYIRAENRLFDACIDAVGYEAACAYPSTSDCAADIVIGSLVAA